MNDIEAVKTALDEWNQGLDQRDVERMLATCDPDVIVCNEHQATTVGIQAVRDKYAPRLEAGTFESDFELERLKIYGDVAILIGHFGVRYTETATGAQRGGEGRLLLVYRRHTDGSWKLLVDIDNNDERSGSQ